MNAILALEDGTWFQGVSAGAPGETTGEVVFNTSMTGYQEILTDPSYAGQIVTMTAPQIGNYGVAAADTESSRPQVAGFVMRDASPVSSNWRSTGTLRDYLVRHNIVAIGDIDTRQLTKVCGRPRDAGVIATGSVEPSELIERARRVPHMEGSDLVKDVTTAEAYDFETSLARCGHRRQLRYRAAAPRRAHAQGRRLRLRHQDQHPAPARRLRLQGPGVSGVHPRREVMAWQPDGIFLSNGPGDPAAVTYAIQNIKELIDGEVRCSASVSVTS